MILFSAKKSAVHEMHLDAVEGYAIESGLAVSVRVHGFGAIFEIVKSPDRVLFSQSTGLASLVVLPMARLLGKTVVHYMHEPTPLRQKLGENPPIKSVIWHCVQWLEVRCASTVMVSRQALLEQAATVYGVSERKIVLAPLLMPLQQHASQTARRVRITYLGRIDERRYFRQFLEAAPTLAQRGYRPTLLTGDVKNVDKYAEDLPAEVDLHAEANFSEDLKFRILDETLALWNPKRGKIAQSGVTADAVRYGLSILLTDKDPSYQELLDQGIAINYHDGKRDNLLCLDAIDSDAVAASAANVFSKTHGRDAFVQSYLPALQ